MFACMRGSVCRKSKTCSATRTTATILPLLRLLLMMMMMYRSKWPKYARHYCNSARICSAKWRVLCGFCTGRRTLNVHFHCSRILCMMMRSCDNCSTFCAQRAYAPRISAHIRRNGEHFCDDPQSRARLVIIITDTGNGALMWNLGFALIYVGKMYYVNG